MADTAKYTFRWEHPAEEVYVTGTFDDWGKTIQLEKNAEGVFEKTVDLPRPSEPVFYKFVKDGEWVTLHTAPTETDTNGNTNNVLKSTDFISSAAPGSSTAALAAKVPTEVAKHTETAKGTPGAFPETPAKEPGEFSVKPIPASAGSGNPINLKPGEPVPAPSTINSNTIQSGVYDDPELKAADETQTKTGEQTFGVNPIPATAGLGNPVTVAPGEPLPPTSQATTNPVNSTVKTDKESYEKSDALPGTSQTKVEAANSAFAIPPLSAGSGTRIPESGGIPMGSEAPRALDADPGVTIQSAGPQSTSAGLAAQVPLEKDKIASGATGVPEVVKESQKEAHIDPEATANSEAVKEKNVVEQELLKDIKPVESAGEPAPTVAAATSAEAPKAQTNTLNAPAAPEAKRRQPSRDVSPKTNPADPSTPSSRKGNKNDESKVGRRMSAAFRKATGTPESSSKTTATTTPANETKADKKSKRRSILVKIKEAFK